MVGIGIGGRGSTSRVGSASRATKRARTERRGGIVRRGVSVVSVALTGFLLLRFASRFGRFGSLVIGFTALHGGDLVGGGLVCDVVDQGAGRVTVDTVVVGRGVGVGAGVVHDDGSWGAVDMRGSDDMFDCLLMMYGEEGVSLLCVYGDREEKGYQ